MNTNVISTKIGMREFLRNTKKIKLAVARGEEFEVLDHATPVFRVTAVVPEKIIKYTFADIKKLQFKSGDKHMADNIDNYLYGAR
jgi:antitoxin (DNA-binding transcriptional repressor) of toxin-antitoxin stability system